MSESKKKNRPREYCLCRKTHSDVFMIQCDGCEEWYHGNCVNINKRQAKKIDHFYCVLCKETKNLGDDKDKFKPIPNYDDVPPTRVKNKTNNNNLLAANSLKKRMDNDYLPENVNEDPDEDDYSDDEDEYDEFRISTAKKTKVKVKRKYRKKVAKNNKPNKKKSNEKAPKKRGRKKGQGNNAKENRGRGRKKNVDKKSKSKTHSDESSDESKSSPIQCYGPGCVFAARKGSKYCSDQCGLNLADKRMALIIPERIKTWKSIPIGADERSEQELEEIKRENIKATEILAEIERKKVELERIIQKGKSCLPLTEDECAALEQDLDNDAIPCVTCSQECSVKTALKHKERCFNKIEYQTSFESKFKTKTEKPIFCEAYNEKNKTYCKRLRIMCPEHNKDQNKIADNEVCGCPLRHEDPFQDSNDNFCRILRKKCYIHTGWEKTRRAVLDAEIVAQYYKMDELFERQKKIRQSMSNRGGLLALLLHETKYENSEPTTNQPSDNTAIEVD